MHTISHSLVDNTCANKEIIRCSHTLQLFASSSLHLDDICTTNGDEKADHNIQRPVSTRWTRFHTAKIRNSDPQRSLSSDSTLQPSKMSKIQSDSDIPMFSASSNIFGMCQLPTSNVFDKIPKLKFQINLDYHIYHSVTVSTIRLPYLPFGYRIYRVVTISTFRLKYLHSVTISTIWLPYLQLSYRIYMLVDPHPNVQRSRDHFAFNIPSSELAAQPQPHVILLRRYQLGLCHLPTRSFRPLSNLKRSHYQCADSLRRYFCISFSTFGIYMSGYQYLHVFCTFVK
jgi:hypothetical protein